MAKKPSVQPSDDKPQKSPSAAKLKSVLRKKTFFRENPVGGLLNISKTLPFHQQMNTQKPPE
ncbi:MAG: hypothetical protein ABI618_09075, partial [Nitrospirota bacterium]